MRQQIGKYSVTIWSFNNQIAGYIGLYTANYKRIAQITFYNDGHDVPKNSTSGDIVNLNFPFSKYQVVLDVLRNEDPVWLNYNDINALGTISSSKEPVGEGE